ncbi:DUF3820 family protein [Mucilaginibacter pallidiroseus]|uniref:DUF3820 family protein n=1 Tax=Mucilaginibacter pallidiroseus TaxID=2599295 RepID=A0A563UK65_9SPHI|nr:DUF3820 family protein [Mucilaginibacter pallidiroseus]
MQPDPTVLIDMVNTRMPFGKYQGTLICDIPVSYLEWMHSKGFPPGKLGMLLASVFEMKTNGLDKLLRAIKEKHGKSMR